MISVVFENDKYVINVTYKYLLFFTKKAKWWCKNERDLKQFTWIYDKTLHHTTKKNYSISIDMNKSIEECIFRNNIIQQMLLSY